MRDTILFILRGVVLSGLLLYAGIVDQTRREIPNWIPPAVMAAALIDFPQFHPVSSVLGLAVLFLLLYLVWRSGGLGGGDLKLAASIGFFFGFWKSLFAVSLSLLLALALSALTGRHKKDKPEGTPLAPYFGAGCFIIYWLWR